MPFRTRPPGDVLKERFKPMLPVQAPIQRANEPLPTNLQIQPSSDEAKLNKLEAAWFDVLRSRRPDWIGIEPFGLKLAAARCRYHPDFITLQNGQLTAWETKGKWFTDDGKVKLKVAAREYPFIRFVLVTRDKTGWTESEVKP